MEVRVRHVEGLQFEATARGHTVRCDQPQEMGGEDHGMTPPELFLAALGACAGYRRRIPARAGAPHRWAFHTSERRKGRPAGPPRGFSRRSLFTLCKRGPASRGPDSGSEEMPDP